MFSYMTVLVLAVRKPNQFCKINTISKDVDIWIEYVLPLSISLLYGISNIVTDDIKF